MKTLCHIVLSFFFLLVSNYQSQGYYYKQYTTANQLISNNVYHSLLDRKGYMWFFTSKGISKFDGQHFKNFTVFEGLSDHEAFYGFEDKSGRLWVFTNNGTPCYIKNDTVYNQTNSSLLKKLPVIRFIESIVEDDDSSLYIGYWTGQLIKINHSDCKWIIKSTRLDNLSSMYRRKDTLVLCNTYSRIFIKNDKIVLVKKDKQNNNYNEHKKTLLANIDGINIYSNDSLIWQYTDAHLNAKNLIHLYYDEHENIFCATNNGLIVLNIKTRKKHLLFENVKVTCTKQDVLGNYWVTTLGNGIYYLNKNLDKINPLNINDTKQFVNINKQVFFVRDGNVYYVENDSVHLIKVQVDAKQEFEPLYISEKYFFYANGEQYYLNRTTKKISKINAAVKHIFEIDSDSYICVGRHSMATISIGKNVTSRYFGAEAYLHKACFDNLKKILYYDENHILYSYSLQTQQTAALDSFDKAESIENIHFIGRKLIILTNGKNVYVYDCDQNYKKSVINRLPFVCYDILNIKNKCILNTNRGYFINNALNENFTIPAFLNKNQFLEYPISPPDLLSLNTTENNIICNIGGSYYIFNDSILNKETRKPYLFIDDFIINGKHYGDRRAQIRNSINTHVSISASSLKFDNASSNFEYRIIDNDTSQWYTSASGKIDVLLKEAGVYTIEVRAFSLNKLVSDSQYVSFTIFPPFIYSAPFYLILVVFISLVVLVLVKRHNKKRKKIFENELNYLQLEHKAINSLLNPHFIFNAINNIQNLVNMNSNETANNYLAILSKLIRQNIDNLQFNFIPVSKELTLIKNYIRLQNLRFDNRITLEINDTIDDTDDIQIPPLLIHTFIENSVVHGFKKEMTDFTICIELSLSTDHYLIVRIEDNGTGLTETKNDSLISDKLSLGIDFIRKRLTRLSDFYKVSFTLDINDLKDKGKTGTEVLIILYAKFRNNGDGKLSDQYK